VTTEEQAEAPRPRIVVALDASPHGRAAMAAAAEIASRLEAEVFALFIEDLDLIHWAGLPGASEMGHDARVTPFDPRRLERRLRSEGREARAVCEHVASQLRVPVSFEVVRGAVTRELRTAAEGAAMIVLGRASAATRTRARLGGTARSLLGSCAATVAVVTAASPSFGRPVAVVHDGSEASSRALDLAIRLAGEDHQNLVVLVPNADEGRADALVAEAIARADEHGLTPRCLRFGRSRVREEGGAGASPATPESDRDANPASAPDSDADSDLIEVVVDCDARALVLPRDCAALGDRALAEMVEALPCAVFVVG